MLTAEARAAGRPVRWAFPAWLAPQVRAVRALGRLYAQDRSCPKCIAPEAGMLLHALARDAAPRLTLEIGCYLGVSTIWLAAGTPSYPERSVRSIDTYGPGRRATCFEAPRRLLRRQRARRNIRRAGLTQRVRVDAGDADALVAAVRRALPGQCADLVFIDGDHTLAGVAADLRAVEPLLGRGSRVILHDVFEDQSGCAGPRRLLDDLAAHAEGGYEHCDLYTAPRNFGMAVMRRLDGPERGEERAARETASAAVDLAFALGRNLRPRTAAWLARPGQELAAMAGAMALKGADPLHCRDDAASPQPMLYAVGAAGQLRAGARYDGLLALERIDSIAVCHEPSLDAIAAGIARHGGGVDLLVVDEAVLGAASALHEALLAQLNTGGFIWNISGRTADTTSARQATARAGVIMRWCRLDSCDLGQRIA